MNKEKIIDRLLVYINNRHEDDCISLIEEYPFLCHDIIEKDGSNLFLTACFNGCKKVAQYLVAQGIDIQSQNKHGMNALFFAVCIDDLELVKYLYELGVDAEHKDWLESTPLFRACDDNFVDIIKYFIEQGVNINYENPNGFSFLTYLENDDITIEMSYLMEHLDKFNEKNQKIIKKIRLKHLVEKGEVLSNGI
jgi:ankyrin repeat protein